MEQIRQKILGLLPNKKTKQTNFFDNFAAVNEALNIERVRETILQNAGDLDDLKNFSLLNSTWNLQSRKYLDSNSVCLLTRETIVLFTNKLKKCGLNNKSVALCYWVEKEVGFAEELEAMEKIAPYIFKTCVHFSDLQQPKSNQIFKLLSLLKNLEHLTLEFSKCDMKETKTEQLNELQKEVPLSFPKLKSFSIQHSSPFGTNFISQFILPAFSNSCKSLIINYCDPTEILSAVVKFPGKLEQFERIEVDSEMNNEIWEFFMKRELSLLKHVKFQIADKDARVAEEFLGKHKNQLMSLTIEINLQSEKERRIPEMENLKSLCLSWYWGTPLEVSKVKLAQSNVYPKLKELEIWTDDTKGRFAFLRNFRKERQETAEKLEKVTAGYQMYSCKFCAEKTEIIVNESGKAKKREERKLKKLFAHAKIVTGYKVLPFRGGVPYPFCRNKRCIQCFMQLCHWYVQTLLGGPAFWFIGLITNQKKIKQN